jgi:peptidyl-prolyl cis-trans isomerase SurA
LSDAQLRAALAQVTPQILLDAVDELLEVQRGRELGFHLTDEQFTDVIAKVKKDNNINTDADLEKGLHQQGLTLAQFRERVERTSIRTDVERQEVRPKLNLTDEESHEYYLAHPDEFQTTASATVREILVAVPVQKNASGQQVVNAQADDIALTKIKAIRARIVAGEDFVTLVKEVSEAPSKSDDGLLPPIDLDAMNPDLRAMFEKLKPGESSEPIHTTRGYQLFKLESLTRSTLQPFEKVRDQITDKVFSTREDSEMRKYVDKLRADALIEWRSDDFHKMYDQQLAARAGSGGGV